MQGISSALGAMILRELQGLSSVFDTESDQVGFVFSFTKGFYLKPLLGVLTVVAF